MFELTTVVDFEAAHCIHNYPGKCRRLHGHNWKVEVAVCGTTLNELGMLIDFRELKQHVNTIIENLDHYYLNEIEPFTSLNPTAENIACYIYEELLKTEHFSGSVWLQSVKVWESERSAVKYTRGDEISCPK